MMHQQQQQSNLIATVVGEIPVDSAPDIDEIHGDDAGVVFGLSSLVKYQKRVSVNSGSWRYNTVVEYDSTFLKWNQK